MPSEGPAAGRGDVLIVDGYNLIKRVDQLKARLDGPRGLEDARSYLLGWLRRHQAQRGRRVVLVLDGPRAGRSDFGPVEVHYAPSADELVVALAGPSALVVTSDSELTGLARGRGAQVITSEDFWQALVARDRRSIPPSRPASGNQRAASNDSGDDDDGDEGSGQRRGARRGGNPKRKSKAERRREQERSALMRRV